MPPPRHPSSSPPSPWHRRLRALEVRDIWWACLDTWESRPRLRYLVLGSLALSLLLGLGVRFIYPGWHDRSQAGLIRKWVEMGRPDLAMEEVSRILAARPDNSDAWRLAAELSRAAGDHTSAAKAWGRASTLSPHDTELTLQWATDALLADQTEPTARILARLPASIRDNSPPAQRLLGELARRAGDLPAARLHHATALRLAGPNPQDTATLGRLLLLSPEVADRRQGREQLDAVAGDPEWGAVASRTLLADALARRAPAPELVHHARNLVINPLCTLDDLPTALRVLAAHAPGEYATQRDRLQVNFSPHPDRALLLIDCLNTIGRPADALAWSASFPPAYTARPALAVALAESRRLIGDWNGLDEQTARGDWGDEYEFLRLAYALESARHRGDPARRDETWRTLQARVAHNGAHAAYVAGALYVWGSTTEAVAIAEVAAEDPNSAESALGMLVRHYQTQGDGAGQYRAFRRLHALRPKDADIRNNLAYFAALLGDNLVQARALAETNLKATPGRIDRLATLAFVLVRSGQAEEALARLAPHLADTNQSAALALPRGLALASLRRKAEAAAILRPLLPQAQTTEEAALIRAALEQ